MKNSKGLTFLVSGALLIGSVSGCGSPQQEEEPFLNIRGGEEEGDPPPGVCCAEPSTLGVEESPGEGVADEESLGEGVADDGLEAEGAPSAEETVESPPVAEQNGPPERSPGTMTDERPFLNVRGPDNNNSPR